MAKVTAPLMSFTARGAIAKALVFFPWKGINAVRQYVIPSNPDTKLQQTQRGYLKTLVPAIHAAMAAPLYPLASADQVAYSALATRLGRVMTWFNMACKLGMDALRLADGYTIYSHGLIVDTDKDDFRPRIYINDDDTTQVLNGTFYLGSSRSNLNLSIPALVEVGVRADLDDETGFSGLVTGNKYFWQFRPDATDPCEGSDSGIYYAYAV